MLKIFGNKLIIDGILKYECEYIKKFICGFFFVYSLNFIWYFKYKYKYIMIYNINEKVK